MDKTKKHLLRAYTCVGRGWWGIIDKYIPAILEIDPDCDFEPKEKYGDLRLQAMPSTNYPDSRAVYELVEEAERLSCITCEYCGKPGKLRHENRYWVLTLCDDCDKLTTEQVRELHNEKFRMLSEMEE